MSIFYPAAQFPCADPDMLAHSVDVKQVPFLFTPFLKKKGEEKATLLLCHEIYTLFFVAAKLHISDFKLGTLQPDNK